MSELEPTGIDRVLRQSMTAPVPGLPAGFEQSVMRKLRRPSESLDRSRRMLLAGYGIASAMASAVVMRSQGLGWGVVLTLILGPLALVALGRGVVLGAKKS